MMTFVVKTSCPIVLYCPRIVANGLLLHGYMFFFGKLLWKKVGIFSHVFGEVVCCIIGSPRSMNVVCPDNIGRDSWDRGGQEAVVCPDCNSPQEFGGRNPHQVYTHYW